MRVLASLSLLVLALFAGPACAGTGGFGRGAYSPEYEPLRAELGDLLGHVLVVAKDDVPAIRTLVRDANANEPGAGTGALVQRVLLLVALEVATGGQLDVSPARGDAPPSASPHDRAGDEIDPRLVSVAQRHEAVFARSWPLLE